MARKSAPAAIPPTLSPERAYAALKRQLEKLDKIKGQDYLRVEHDEQEWTQLTESIVEKAFGNPSTTLSNFHSARWVGEHAMVPYGSGPPHGMNQNNYTTNA